MFSKEVKPNCLWHWLRKVNSCQVLNMPIQISCCYEIVFSKGYKEPIRESIFTHNKYERAEFLDDVYNLNDIYMQYFYRMEKVASFFTHLCIQHIYDV